MRWIMVIACLAGSASLRLSAQQPEGDKAVVEAVKQLFMGMKLGDSAMVRTIFDKEVTMATVSRDKQNNPMITRESSISGFLKAVGTPHPDQWNEEIWDIDVKRDGDFAQVWCSYAFYRGHSFSHCGVDAFQLHLGKEGWKIFHLADTRRTDNCQVPNEIRRKHQQ